MNNTAATVSPVVVGVNDSPTARRAAERAAEIARLLGAPLHLVAAVNSDRSSFVKGPGSDSWDLGGADATRQFLASLAVTFEDLEVTTAAREGKPGEALIEEAEKVGAGVIVVGNRRMKGVSRVLGAVALDVAHRANCDVYIAHTTV